MHSDLPLFSRFPRLREMVPHLPLGALPTPVQPMPRLAALCGRDDLFVKRDDLSGELYGGNKVRKLEFLLADAQTRGATRIITSGGAGSNHALATALYARSLGFAVTLMLFEQPVLATVGPNLLADYASGAELLYDTSYARHVDHLREVAQHYEREEGRPPYIVAAGGSSATGTVGFVNAAFELRDQIDRGLLPEPAKIFVAWGTMGTAAGLLLGCRAAGLRCAIAAVRVVPEAVASVGKCAALFEATRRLLTAADPSFPHCSFNECSFHPIDVFLGEGYGLSTKEGLAAIDCFREYTDIAPDPVYTGKAAAALLTAAREGADAAGGPLLFWHTKSSSPLPHAAKSIDYHLLPSGFHRYF